MCNSRLLHDGNSAKCKKHGMTREGIEAFFRAEPRTAPDPLHAIVEQRFIAVGYMPDRHPAFVAFCWRGDIVRPVSARYMHEKEARSYENRTRHDH